MTIFTIVLFIVIATLEVLCFYWLVAKALGKSLRDFVGFYIDKEEILVMYFLVLTIVLFGVCIITDIAIFNTFIK